MTDDLHTIGELAQRTGLPVRTIRFWSDTGVVTPATRSAAGYRLYDAEAVGRLDLVRTLRELGLGLETVRQILGNQLTLSDVAETHVHALEAEIRTLRLRCAVLRTVTKRESTTEELTLMHKLATLSAQERQQIINDFVDKAFSGVTDEDSTAIADLMRDLPPTLPDDPTPAQVDAWIELAELVSDTSLQQTLRRMVLTGTPDNRIEFGLTIRPLILEHAAPAIATGIPPESLAAEPILSRIVPPDLPATETAALVAWLDAVAEPEVERYWELLGLINGHPPTPPAVPAFAWLSAALRAHR
ncbi:MAG: MerR family transcriptional regulator [Nocardia sp.]|uniref:helix-turn-helix domain-containing protein n=1 Tax=Nocardia sp. TaxID=1821 RepID=UPI00262E7EF4|nr:MerR family transcriptional regulator [Nocardia sp.]MCU1640337.1 MerR family transcriptional regulator [Nocardia sp.]